MPIYTQSHPSKLQDNVINVEEIRFILYLTINAKALLDTKTEQEGQAIDTFI
jgi:hypothetical protein